MITYLQVMHPVRTLGLLARVLGPSLRGQSSSAKVSTSGPGRIVIGLIGLIVGLINLV